VDFTLIQSVWSIVIFVTFIGIVLWAYSSKRKAAFDEAARLPFDDEVPVSSNDPAAPKNTSAPKKISAE
jgi:cytochrome c oxidase cbb3-type subunit 4